MRRFWTFMGFGLLLAACAGTPLTYELSIDREEPGKITELTLASIRVIERRIASLEQEVDDLSFSTAGERPRITFHMPDAEAAAMLTADLQAPFSLEIMSEAPEDAADLVVEGHGGFQKTGINHHHVEWAEALPEQNGKGGVRLLFSPEGRDRMEQLFVDFAGQNIGIVVRDRLVAKILVENRELREDILITGIPSIELARIFSDDVNVGLHVTFTPVP